MRGLVEVTRVCVSKGVVLSPLLFVLLVHRCVCSGEC